MARNQLYTLALFLCLGVQLDDGKFTGTSLPPYLCVSVSWLCESKMLNLLPTANAMNCPYCLDVLACAANEVPKVDCTGYIVNRTVLTLGGIFQDLTAYTTPDTVYSCVEVNFRRDGECKLTNGTRGRNSSVLCSF